MQRRPNSWNLLWKLRVDWTCEKTNLCENFQNGKFSFFSSEIPIFEVIRECPILTGIRGRADGVRGHDFRLVFWMGHDLFWPVFRRGHDLFSVGFPTGSWLFSVGFTLGSFFFRLVLRPGHGFFYQNWLDFVMGIIIYHVLLLLVQSWCPGNFPIPNGAWLKWRLTKGHMKQTHNMNKIFLMYADKPNIRFKAPGNRFLFYHGE